MTKEEFTVRLHSLLLSPDNQATDKWVEWTADIGNQKDIESYLQDLYNAFDSVRQKYGVELTQSIYDNMPNYVLMYPNEFMLAAEHLHNGLSFDAVGQMIENEMLNPDAASTTQEASHTQQLS